MSVTLELKEFIQGWALQTPLIGVDELDLDRPFELRGKSRAFRAIKLIGFGNDQYSLPVEMALDANEFGCLRRLAADPRIRWCLHSLVADTGSAPFDYDAFVSIDFPKTDEELERARAAYRREIAAWRNGI